MHKTELLWESINLTIVGMGFVFVFLFLLICSTVFMSKVITFCFPEKLPEKSSGNPAKETFTQCDVERLRPVIVAAIAHHRRQQKSH